jgi:formyl-CoA transferase
VGGFVDQPWKRVCTALGIDDAIAIDPRFQDRPGLVAHEEELQAILLRAFAQKTREEALKLLEEQDILCGPVYEDPEVFTDPQVIHNQMVLEADHPVAGKLKLVAHPVKLSGTPGTLRLTPPTVGQHNAEVLSFLGYAEAEIHQLQEKGALGAETRKASTKRLS